MTRLTLRHLVVKIGYRLFTLFLHEAIVVIGSGTRWTGKLNFIFHSLGSESIFLKTRVKVISVSTSHKLKINNVTTVIVNINMEKKIIRGKLSLTFLLFQSGFNFKHKHNVSNIFFIENNISFITAATQTQMVDLTLFRENLFPFKYANERWKMKVWNILYKYYIDFTKRWCWLTTS